MKNIYWIGTRQSDIEDIEDFFEGSVTIFGNNYGNNISYCAAGSRINHNLDNKDCDNFFIETLESLCQRNDQIRFMFYNPIFAYKYGKLIMQHTLCLNSYELLETLSDKQRSRFVLKDIVDIIPYIVLRGADCNIKNICKYFVNYHDFVIQKVNSSGGEGTFHIDKFSNINFIDYGERYLISPYIEDSIPLNAHIIIYDDDIFIFPPSIQIITEIENKLLYCGGDYICYKTIPENIKLKIYQTIRKIGWFVHKRGYRGILGIDFVLNGQRLYFMEFNTRFQASSQLINKALSSQHAKSLQEMNLEAFEHILAPKVETHNIDYSNYTYTTSNIAQERLKKIISSCEISQIQADGYDVESKYPNEKNIYLIRCVFERNICSINNGKVVLHPNIYVENIKNIIDINSINYKAYTKIALLNHGVTLSDSALNFAKQFGEINKAVFDAIDAVIFNNVYVNIPYHCKFNTLSPFTIDTHDGKFVLMCDGKIITDIELSFTPDMLINKHTKSGVPYDAVINLATDRIRINPAPICYYKKHGLGCKFCNLPNNNISYNLDDIKEIIDYCLAHVAFKHFLIGGGTYSTDEKGWQIIAEIARYIRSKTNKDIYLMSIPPKELYTLNRLKDAGITEVAFNIEIFNRKLAKAYMPGKGLIEKEQYMSILSHAVSLWGNTGNVRSLLIYGFDTDNEFLNGIEKICQLGIEPVISIFRPLNKTVLSQLNPPPTADVIAIYEECSRIAKKHSMILGPNCPMCQNNTLSFSEAK